MDKGRFIEVAPYYYAIAVIEHFQASQVAGFAVSRQSILKHYTAGQEDGFPNEFCYLEKTILLDRAIELLVQHKMITILRDDFGPSIFLLEEKWRDPWEALGDNANLPINRYRRAPERSSWLRSALQSVNETFDKLGIQADDFETPDSEWAPLPLNRDDPALNQAIARLDETIEEVRADNGYAITLPEERDYVLERLSSLANRLKHAAQVSYGYVVRNGLEPLATLIRRFSNAALETSASAARSALADWLKEQGVKILHHFLG
jgi:hypothetical protein